MISIAICYAEINDTMKGLSFEIILILPFP